MCSVAMDKWTIKMRLNIYHYECLSQEFVKIQLIDITNNNERQTGRRGCTRWCQGRVCWEAYFYHNDSVVNVLNLYSDVQWCHFDKRIGWRIFDVLVRREAACLFFHIHGAYVSVLGLSLILFKFTINRPFRLNISLLKHFSWDKNVIAKVLVEREW